MEQNSKNRFGKSDCCDNCLKDDCAYENRPDYIGTSDLGDVDFIRLADLYKSFSDSSRCKILYLLLKNKMKVGEIAEVLEMSQSAVSHQLAGLRTARLVKHEKSGKAVLYSLDDEHVRAIYQKGLEHISHI